MKNFKLKQIRKSKKIRGRDVANILGVQYTGYTRYENTIPLNRSKFYMVIRLANILDCDIIDLLEDDEVKEEYQRYIDRQSKKLYNKLV